MNRILTIALVMLACVAPAYAQGKGVDRQSERVREAGSDRQPGNNGAKQDVGTGRGIDFGRGRTPDPITIPNPLRVTARRDTLITALEELMRERNLILDSAASKTDAGILVSQPYTFSKGAIVTEAELNRFAALPVGSDRNWIRGRYTLVVEVQQIDGVAANLAVNARIEARGASITGPEWVSLPSSGIVEQDFLTALLAKLNIAPPTPASAPQ